MKVEIPDGFCVTYSSQEDEFYGGYCPFKHRESNKSRQFSELPSHPDEVNDAVCGPYHREGLLCGICANGHGPAVYSYDLKCANCSKLSEGNSIILFLFLEFVSGALFFFFVVIFRLSVTSGPLLGYVLFCQVFAFWQAQKRYIYDYIEMHSSGAVKAMLKFSLTISDIWRVNFLKTVIPSFCVSERLTGIHIQILGLVTAINPIVLFIITCILMQLHARNYRTIHILWRPFSFVLKKINITTVTSDAVLHALATLTFMSTSDVLQYTAAIVTGTSVRKGTDCSIYKNVMYFDPSITWLSQKHLVYVVVALIPFTLLVLIPSFLLLIYPTRIYRYLSRCLSARKRLAITAYVEAIHNCFKDGLNGTRDYRWFPGALVLTAIIASPVFLGTELGAGFFKIIV